MTVHYLISYKSKIMAIKTTINYSPNFEIKRRKKKQVKYLVFHYTGMKSEKSAIDRLTKIQSEVSSHYLIKKNGEILRLVPDLYVAWHSGKSEWFNEKSLSEILMSLFISSCIELKIELIRAKAY